VPADAFSELPGKKAALLMTQAAEWRRDNQFLSANGLYARMK
jgi:hypothetical protein